MVQSTKRIYAFLAVAFCCMFISPTFTPGQTAMQVFRMLVTTSSGEFINARLNDNIYLDFTVSPMSLKAKRYLPNVQLEPVTVPNRPNFSVWRPRDQSILLKNYSTVEVYVNGLYLLPVGDYKLEVIDGVTYVVAVYIPSWAKDNDPYLVQARLQP